MKPKRIPIIIFTSLLAPLLTAGILAEGNGLVWPINGKLLLTSIFGESRITHFHDGLDLAAVNTPIVPMADGRILLYRFLGENPYAPVMGPGNFVLVQHPGADGGSISSYYHLAEKIPAWESPAVSAGETVLGYVSNTGHAAGAHLHFNMTRRGGRESFNLLPKLPALKDSNPPKVGGLFLYQTSQKKKIHIAQNDSFSVSRDYPLMVEIIDSAEQKGTRRGIYKIKASHNGRTIADHRFDYIRFKNGKWRLNGERPVEQVFFGKFYLLDGVRLSDGTNTIRIICEDFQGNRAEKEFEFNIQRI